MISQLGGVFAVAAVAAAALGYGTMWLALLARRYRLPGDRATRLWIALTLGTGTLAHLLVLAGLAHGLTPAMVRAVVAGGALLGGFFLLRSLRGRNRDSAGFSGSAFGKTRLAPGAVRGKRPENSRRLLLRNATRLAGIVVLGSVFPAASFPPLAYDVLEYHLQAPRLFLLEGRLDGDSHNFFTRMPLEAEMVYSAGQSVVTPTVEDDRAAKWLAAAWVAMFAWGCGVLARRMGARSVTQWAAVALGGALPIAGKVALDAYNDGAAAVFAQLLVFGLLGVLGGADRNQRRRRPDLLLAAIGGGLAVACKWGVLPYLIVPGALLILLTALARRNPRRGAWVALLFPLGCAVVFSPWMVRAFLVTGNPVYPWAGSIFASSAWSPDQEAFLVRTHRPQRPWQGAYWAKTWQGMNGAAPALHVSLRPRGEDSTEPPRGFPVPVGVLVVISGFFLAGRRSRLAKAGATLGLLSILAWALVAQAPDRFLLPGAGVLIASGAVVTECLVHALRRKAGWRVVALGAAVALASAVVQAEAQRIALYRTGGYFEALANPILREQAREEVLGRPLVALQGQVALAHRRDGGRILILYEARGLLFPLPHSLNTVFDRSVLLDLIGEAESPEEIDQALIDKGFTHVVVNEYELDRLVRFYPPLQSDRILPPREACSKSPLDPYPWVDLYRPYARDPRFHADRVLAWQKSLLGRARWRYVGPGGLVICLTRLGSN